jgi:hypothetical protein
MIQQQIAILASHSHTTTPGSLTVTASVSGVSTPAIFKLTAD